MALSIYLTLMLNSKSTTRQTIVPDDKLQKVRVKRGVYPLQPHHIVRIVPQQYVRASVNEATGERRSPRLHWRKSHLRFFDHATPNSKWVSFGGREGWAVVIPRMLISKAEHGSVSHEYRVIHE